MSSYEILDEIRDITNCPDGKSITQHVSALRAVQAPRPSSEQHRVVRIAVINADLRGDTEESEALREAFPDVFEGEVGRG